MKDRKTMWPRFASRNRNRMIAFLENQALKGWLFDGFGGYGWKFRRIEPQKLRFSVVYFSISDKDNLDEKVKMEEFREFCAHDGWQFAGASESMHVFYSEKENPIPIETDPVLEVESIVKAQGNYMGKSLAMLFAIFALAVFYVWRENRGSLILLLTHQWGVWVILLGITCLLEILIFTAKFTIWENKARRQAQEYGEFLDESPMMAMTKWVAYGWLLLTVAALIFAAGWKVFLWRVGTWGLMFTAIFIAWGRLKEKNYEKPELYWRLWVAYFLIHFVGMMFADAVSEKLDVGFDRNAPEGSAWVQYQEVPPLDAGECTIDLRETGLLARYQVEGTEAAYTVLEVKADFLYDLCLDEMLHDHFFPADAAPWGAQRAYQLGVSESPSNPWWILCYEDRIVEISLPEMPTAEQMSLVCEILRNEQKFENSKNK